MDYTTTKWQHTYVHIQTDIVRIFKLNKYVNKIRQCADSADMERNYLFKTRNYDFIRTELSIEDP